MICNIRYMILWACVQLADIVDHLKWLQALRLMAIAESGKF